MSPSDYQSFIYFRAVSHKKRVYKSVTCHRFLLRPLLEPVCWVTLVTRVFSFFCGGGCHPCHPSALRKNWKKGWFSGIRLYKKTIFVLGILNFQFYFKQKNIEKSEFLNKK